MIQGWNDELSPKLLSNRDFQNLNPNSGDKGKPHDRFKMKEKGVIPQHVAKWKWVSKNNDLNPNPGPSNPISGPTRKTNSTGRTCYGDGFIKTNKFLPLCYSESDDGVGDFPNGSQKGTYPNTEKKNVYPSGNHQAEGTKWTSISQTFQRQNRLFRAAMAPFLPTNQSQQP